jgi:NADH-quinone oxidoreductase subunit M
MESFLTSLGYNNWVLPALLIIPVIGAVLLLAMRGSDADESSKRSARMIAFATLLIEFLVSIGLWWTFDPTTSAWQASIDKEWIPMWGIRFTLGIDGIALMMILLTTFIMPL